MAKYKLRRINNGLMPLPGLPWPDQTTAHLLLLHGDLQRVLVPCTRLRTKTTLDYSLVEDRAVVETAELAQ